MCLIPEQERLRKFVAVDRARGKNARVWEDPPTAGGLPEIRI